MAVYRRLEEFCLSIRATYSDLTEAELDDVVGNILPEFPNSGYESIRGHLLARGVKIQENRVREAMRRADPEGTVDRALQLRITHRRLYNVRAPLSLWHMDGNHKLISFKDASRSFNGGHVHPSCSFLQIRCCRQ